MALQKVLKDRRARADADSHGYGTASTAIASTKSNGAPLSKGQTTLKIPILETPAGAQPMSVTFQPALHNQIVDHSQDTEDEPEVGIEGDEEVTVEESSVVSGEPMEVDG